RCCMGEVTMPRLSDTMSEGTVGRWLKQPGDPVVVGEIIAEIETDKATMELEAFESGTLQQIIVPEGKTVPIGEVIALIGEGPVVAAAPSAPAPATVTAAPSGPAPAAAVVAAPPLPADENGRILASPVARRIAEELGVDLRQVRGTGPGGRILKENVEEFAARMRAAGQPPAPAPVVPPPAPAPVVPPPAPAPVAPPPAPAPVAPPPATLPGAEAMGRMRRAIARTMSESKPGVPHIYVTIEVDMDAALALREQLIASGVRVSVNDLVVKAAAQALLKVPAVNSSYALTAEGQPGIVRHRQVNVSVAVALDDGLVAPVVKDADKKSLSAISAEIRDMALRARDGKIKQHELEGATFQVSNLGMYGVSEFVSIITPPQAASLAVGAVRRVPVVKGETIGIGQMMTITISADHRVVDGAVAARYLQELKALLENPLRALA
ncbi:MAG: dihydrolipoamide acetyltransferase family protein, partial [Chloroflexaceae bacterium]